MVRKEVDGCVVVALGLAGACVGARLRVDHGNRLGGG